MKSLRWREKNEFCGGLDSTGENGVRKQEHDNRDLAPTWSNGNSGLLGAAEKNQCTGRVQWRMATGRRRPRDIFHGWKDDSNGGGIGEG